MRRTQTLYAVTITWKPPKEPNGDLVAYFVEHGVYQNESTRSVAIDARRPQHAVIQALGSLYHSTLLLHIIPICIMCMCAINNIISLKGRQTELLYSLQVLVTRCSCEPQKNSNTYYVMLEALIVPLSEWPQYYVHVFFQLYQKSKFVLFFQMPSACMSSIADV